jgi:ABC-2 type transport system ATP-binding protein
MHQVEAMCNRIVLIDAGRTVLYGEVDKIKRDYAGNAVTIKGHGEFNAIPGILEIKPQNGEFHMVLDQDTTPQDVFRYLGESNDYLIDRFEISEPSLEDIFISVVQADRSLGMTDA